MKPDDANPQPPQIIQPESNASSQIPPPAPAVKPRRSKKVLLILLLVILLASGGVAAWWQFGKKDAAEHPLTTKNNPLSSSTAKSFIYAYTDGDTAHVKEYDLASKTEKSLLGLVGYQEIIEDGVELDFSGNVDVPIDLAPNKTTLAYIHKASLYTKELYSDAILPVITATADPESNEDTGTTYLFSPSFKLTGGPPGIYNLYGPTWSADGKWIGFVAGHYEGVSVNAINVQSRTYANPQDGFNYISEDRFNNSFALKQENMSLFTAGYAAGNYLKPDVLSMAAYNSNKSKIYGILCPYDKPDTGYSQYMEGNQYDDRSKMLDCGEPEDKKLVAVNTVDASYQEIATGAYDFEMTLIDDRAYLSLTGNKQVAIVNLTDGTTEKLDIVTLAGLASNAKVKTIRTFGNNDAFAVIYYQAGDKYFASVIDLKAKTHVADIPLTKTAGIKPLSLK